MAEASLHTFKGDKGNEDDTDLLSVCSLPSRTKTAQKKAKTSTSRSGAKISDLQNLEEKLTGQLEDKFSTLEGKLEKLFSVFKPNSDIANNRTELVDDGTSGVCEPHVEQGTGTLGARRPLVSLENSLNQDYGLVRNDDMLSLHPREEERRHVLCSSPASEAPSHETLLATRFDKYVPNVGNSNQAEQSSSNDMLRQMFGDDAHVKQSGQTVGLVLDQAQIDLLEATWRCPYPDKLAAYKEAYRQTFPVQEDAAKLLQVPSLDEMTERLLVKKHGPRAAFGTSQSLYSQPFKAIERAAYQGQTAARMGLVTICYGQQALGTLLQNLQSQEPNIDEAIQTVRDVFAISTKSMDQIARAGAFHHMLRRKAAVADTGLQDYKDLQKTALSAPLSSDGIFGKDFEQRLKERQEKDKQLTELMPELNKRYVIPKRKATTAPDSFGSNFKRVKYSTESSYRPYKYDRSPNTNYKRPARGGFTAKPASKSRVSSFRNKGRTNAE